MKKRGLDCVYLDISHKPQSFLKEHFPNIYARCLELGIDMAKQPIPVVPAAHFTCGGVITDLNARTEIPGLYATGETACTGLHGANRLASNSLLECVVFSEAAVKDILAQPKREVPALPHWDASRVTDADEEIVISHNWDELRRFMARLSRVIPALFTRMVTGANSFSMRAIRASTWAWSRTSSTAPCPLALASCK